MIIDPLKMPLFLYLKEHNEIYYGRIRELRISIQKWLTYVPQTFPHYTLHTVEHSDEIILQLSKLLFHEDDINKPSIQLSGTETYILLASAYLHDAGMVVSDKEKIEILTSDPWIHWISEGSGAKRWNDVQALRNNDDLCDDTLRNFLADIQTRFLLAEYVAAHTGFPHIAHNLLPILLPTLFGRDIT
jgi:hypothetical protein